MACREPITPGPSFVNRSLVFFVLRVSSITVFYFIKYDNHSNR